MTPNGTADLRSTEKEVYFRSWDFANSECKLLQSNIQKLVQILYFQSMNNSILKKHCCAFYDKKQIKSVKIYDANL